MKKTMQPCGVYSWSFAYFDGVVSSFGHDRGAPAEWDNRGMVQFFVAVLVVDVQRYSVAETR